MEQKVLLNCDWLALSVILGDAGGVHLPSGLSVDEYDGTNVWERRRIVYNEYGEKVLTLLSGPKSKMLNPYAGLLEVSNQWLYGGVAIDKVLDISACLQPFTIAGVSRVDWCADFVPSADQRDVIESLARGEMYAGSYRSGSVFWSTSDCSLIGDVWRRRKIPHCQSWGHKTSGVKWKLYYKSKELADSGGEKVYDKPYIVDAWSRVGFDVRNVWRLEVSISHLSNLQLIGQKAGWAEVRHDDGAMFESLYHSRFKVRRNEGHKDRSNDTLVDFLPVIHRERYFSRKSEATATRSAEITLMRHLIKSLDDDGLRRCDAAREDVFAHLEGIIDRGNLGNYFRAVTGMWFYEWVEEVRCKAMSSSDADGDSRNGRHEGVDMSKYTPRSFDMPSLRVPSSAKKSQEEDLTLNFQ